MDVYLFGLRRAAVGSFSGSLPTQFAGPQTTVVSHCGTGQVLGATNCAIHVGPTIKFNYLKQNFDHLLKHNF